MKPNRVTSFGADIGVYADALTRGVNDVRALMEG
jgi:hypothetical protein